MNAWARSMKRNRERRGLSRPELAERAGIPKNSLYVYEAGRSEPGLFNLICLADALGIGLDEYIGRKKP